MFSSNPIQHLPFTDLETDGVHLNQNHHYVTGDCFYPFPAVTDNNTVMQQQQLSDGIPDLHYSDANNKFLDSVMYPSEKKTTNLKKNGHSKIHTARGPRDRRVRLSVEVAKKLFYLQDFLGFDKASKTLDWLFKKSKAAITELIDQTKHGSSPCARATDQCEVFLTSGSDDDDKRKNKKSTSKCNSEGKKKKSTRNYKSGPEVNQSRAEARARARERTKVKLQNKNNICTNNSNNVVEDCYRPVIPTNIASESSFWAQIESQNARELFTEPNMSMTSSVLYGHPVRLQMSNTSFINFQ